MAEYAIEGKITFDTSQAQTALKQTASAADQAAGATAKVGDAAKTAQPQIGQFGSALGLAGQAVGQLVPGLGQVVTSAGAATGVIQSLRTAGLGPLGLAVAGVSVAVMGGVALWKAYSDEQKEAKKRTDELKKSLDEQIESLDTIISRNAQIGNERDRAARIAAGQVTSAELEANVIRMEQIVQRKTQLRGSARGATSQAAQSTFRLGLEAIGLGPAPQIDYAEVGRLESNLAASTNRLAQARAQLAQGIREGFVNAPTEEKPKPPTPPRTGGGRRRAEAEAAAISEDPNAAAAASLEEMDRLWNQSEERLRIRREEWDRQAAGEREFQEMLRQIEEDDYLDQLDRNRTYLEARERQEAEAAEQLKAINDSVFQALESALSSSVSAWLDGSKSMGEAALGMVQDVARALTTEAIVQGLKQTALGISALAVGSPTAAGHFAAAAKWAAVGVAAGVAGAATGAFGGAGGGGGAPAAATGGPALTPGTAEGAGTTVVINWGSSGLVYAADRAQLGRDISGMISEAHGRLGRGA
jgi:hypothetical protein